MKKTILYLDQNFASNLAKAENLLDWKDPDREFYRELVALLRSRTREDRLACPTAPFHREESEQGARVRDFIWHVVEELSFGLTFRYFTEISFDQIASAARAYCKLPKPGAPSWAIAFNRNPHESVKRLAVQPRVLVNVPSPDEFVEYLRKSRGLVADTYGKYKETRKGKSRTYQEELRFQKAKLVLEIFGRPQSLNIGPPEFDAFFLQIGGSHIIQHQLSIWNTLSHCKEPWRFFSSDELMQAPFVHIRALLMAADIYFRPDKAPSPSLNTDFNIVASVLPYVDILTTDGYMAELIRRIKLLDRFSAKVFSMRQRRKLMEVLQNL